MITGDFKGVRDIIKTIDRIARASKTEKERMNKERAAKFRQFARASLSSGSLMLAPLSPLTTHIQSIDGISKHPPLVVEGRFAKAMKARPEKKPGDWSTGYRAEDTSGPSKKKKSWTQLAILATTGYFIPLQGRKGMRVRNWFAWKYDIYFKRDKKFLRAFPRPFMKRAAENWEISGRDRAIQERTASTLARVWNR